MRAAEIADEFARKGWVRLEKAVPARAVAPVAKDALARYKALPPPPGDARDVPLGVTLPHTRAFELKTLAPEAYEAVIAIIGGETKLREPSLTVSDGIVVGPPGSKKWKAPNAYDFGWHIDGDQESMRTPSSAEVGLVLYVLWNDVEPRGGGTFFAPGATPRLARHLSMRKEGWKKADLPYWLCVESARPDPAYFEFHGPAGTILVTHPLMIHAASWNESKRPRLLSARAVAFSAPLELGEPYHARTPVERATMTAIDAGGPRR